MAEVGLGTSEDLLGEDEVELEDDKSSGLPPEFEEPEEEPSPDDEVGDSGEEEIEETAEEQEPEEEPAPKETPRAQKRIQDLVSTNKELQQNLERQQQYFQQQLATVQQQQQEQQQKFQQEQLELQRQQIELARQRQEREDDSNLTELEKFKRGILSEAKTEVESALGVKVQALEKQLQEAQEAQKKAHAEAERQQRVVHFSRQADAMLGDVVFKGVNSESQSKLNERAKDVLMTYCAAYGVEPKNAAPQFKQFLDDYAQAVMQGRASSGKKAPKVAGAPASKMSPTAPKQKVSRRWPNEKQLRAANYDSAFDWVADGEPPLPPAE